MFEGVTHKMDQIWPILEALDPKDGCFLWASGEWADI